MRSFLKKIDQVNILVARRIAFGGVLAILTLAALMILDIILRLIPFMEGIAGVNEFIEMFLSVAIAATFPAAVALRSHLRINILNSIEEQTKTWLNVFGSAILFWMFAILAWRVGSAAAVAQKLGTGTAMYELPHYPFYWVICGMLCICTVNQLIVFIGDVIEADRGYDLPLTEKIAEHDAHGTRPQSDLTNENMATTTASETQPISYKTPLAFIVALAISLAVALSFQSLIDVVSSGAKSAPGILAAIIVFVKLGLLLIFVPIAAASALLALTGNALILGVPQSLMVFATEATGFLTNPDVSVLPLFLIMAILASAAGVAEDVYRIAQALFGHLKGGLAMATIGGCAGFGAVTGSSIATVATIGRVALPQMKARGYGTTLSTGSVAAGGTLGSAVPPSGGLVVYAFLTETSLGQLFMAAMIPAAIAVLFYLILIGIWVRVSPRTIPSQEEFSWPETIKALRKGLAVFGLFTLVMGGIYFGWFTVAEAASVGAVYAFFIAYFRGKLKGDAFWKTMGEAASLTGMIYALIMGGLGLAFFFSVTGLPEFLSETVGGMNIHPLWVIAALMVVYVLLGAVMESFAILIITVPIVSGLILDLGFDLIWWGIIMLVVLEIGLVSPPIGMNVFVLHSLVGKEVSLTTIYKGVMPFVSADLIRLALLILVPSLVLWLPSTMF